MSDQLLHGQSFWDRHATSDPLWAVLAFPDKRGGRWIVHDFMQTGEREIALVCQRFAQLQLPAPGGRALDFGCGVGRLTQALARRHDSVVGADISAVMIDLARRLNQYPEKAQYICTADAGLQTLPDHSFQFIYSNIVLQHVPPGDAVRYLREFFRLLGPNGLLVFQLPSHGESPIEAEIKSMSDDAYRAAIALDAPVPASIAASAEFALGLQVRNASGQVWSQPHVGPLAVGNHWLDAAGELMLIQDDGRAPLLQVVPPGLEWPVLLTVHAPHEPGRYVGEIDLVHEGMSWFVHKGSPTLRFTIDVTTNTGTTESGMPRMMKEFPVPQYPDGVLPSGPGSDLPLDFPVNGIPWMEVRELVREHGARLAYLEEDRRAGPEWVSYRYFVVGRSS